MAEQRTLFVPDGLEGERLDAALARLFGVSRTKAADLAKAGEVQLDHRPAGKSDRVSAGDLLEVSLPSTGASASPEVVAEPVPGMSVVHDDDEGDQTGGPLIESALVSIFMLPPCSSQSQISSRPL